MGTFARRTTVTIAAGLTTLAAGSPAVAGLVNAEPADNDTLKPVLVGLTATHNAGTILGIAAIGPTGTPSEISAMLADVAAKHTPPVFNLPGGPDALLEQFPNAPESPPPGESNPIGVANCVYQFGDRNTPVLNDGNDHGISAEYASIFGFNYDPLEHVFSDLGKPGVWHPQADVTVSVSNKYLGASSTALQVRPEFPEGRHILSWRAETKFNPVTDIILPSVLIGTFSASEGYLAKKLALIGPSKDAARRMSKNAHRLFNLAAELNLVEGDVKNSGEAFQWYRDTSLVGATNSASRTVTIWDIHTPYIIDSANLPITPFSRGDTIEEQFIQLEAMDFGGVKFDRIYDQLRARFEPADECGKQFTVGTDTLRSTLLTIGNQNIVEWHADEINGGPYLAVQPLAPNQTLANEQIRTVLTQRISVVDTQAPILIPPAGFARYDEDGIDLSAENFPLGRPRVVDLADPSPTVINDAPDFLAGPPAGEDGVRYTVTWDAFDDSDNYASAIAADPASLVQTITLKRPGTNTAPTAQPRSAAAAQAITAQPVEIWLDGIDTDMIGGRVDPLEFAIESAPVGEREEGDNLTRVSPLLHLADRFRLALHRPTVPPDGSDVRGTVLNQEICVNPTPESQAAFGGVIPVNFVYQPRYVYVDDDGNYLVQDSFFHCDVKNLIGSNEDIPASGELRVIPRLSQWNPEGDLLEMTMLMPAGGLGGYDVIDCLDRSFYGSHEASYPLAGFTVDHTGRYWMEFWLNTNVIVGAGFPISHCSIAPDFKSYSYHGTSTSAGTTWNTSTLSGPVVGDLEADVIYQASPGNGVIVRRSGVQVNLWSLAPADLVGILDLSQLDTWAFSDIKVDSDGNVIVLETDANRVHKYRPTRRTGPDSWELGAYVGWLGSCTTNKVNPATGVPYNRCDEQSGKSRGFACTDRTCNRAADSSGV